MTTARPHQSAPAHGRVLPAETADVWADAVAGTSYVSLSPTEFRSLLRELVRRLEAVLTGRPFRPDAARSVGASLVEAHFTQPRSLSRTVAVLLAVTAQLGADGVADDLVERWHRVVAAVAEGYTTTLRDTVLAEQEELLEAALSARDQAEVALRASERRAEQTKNDFFATVSHELRTPLTPIKGYLQLLVSRGESIGAEQRQELYEVMLSQAELVQHLLDDLLTAASGVAEAEFRIALENADIAVLVKGALAGQGPTSRRFQWLGDDRAGSARCDPVRLRQVVGNLLRNADLYATPGTPVHVSVHRHSGLVEIVVRDFGPGIPPEQAEAVFEPFRRLARGSTPGTGLGLHIAQRLVESMHGRIWLTGAKPGAEFHVAIPSAPSDPGLPRG